MARYSVQFAAPDGKISSDVVEANSERAAISQMEAGGCIAIHVELATAADSLRRKGKSAKSNRLRGGRSLRRAVLDFTHQLAAVAESGIPIIQGLKAIGEQTGHAALRGAINRIVSQIEGGRTLADALDAEPAIFAPIFVKTVAAGEAAGRVPEVLLALARYQEQEAETRGQVKSAMMYPTLVAGSLVLATVFMLIFVVPQFSVLFAKFESQLPMPTRILLAISSFVVHHYVILVVGLISLIPLAKMIFRIRRTRSWLHVRMLKLPVFGDLLLGVYMVRLIEILDLLMRAALPITQSLRVTADSMTNDALRADVWKMLRAVEGGRSMTEAFAETKWLTPLVKRMLAIGEQAGRTDQIFAYLKKYYDTQTQRSVKLLSTLIEPIMVTSLAAMVLFFALAIFLPMWKLLKLVGTN